MARTGQVAKARFLVDWVFDELIDDHGLVMDGIRMSMNGPEVVKNLHPYCQGVMMGACLELTLRLRESPETYEDSMAYQAHVRSVLHAVEKDMATPTGVINWDTRDGDGGLFKGILARYLADVAVRLPDDSEANVAAKKLARKCCRVRKACGIIAWRLMGCRCLPLIGWVMRNCRIIMG